MKSIKKEVPNITENSCRICLKQCTDADQDAAKFSARYSDCTGFPIRNQDVPKKICPTCVSALNKAWYFRNKCNRTEKLLLETFLQTYSEPVKNESAVQPEDEPIDSSLFMAEMIVKSEPIDQFLDENVPEVKPEPTVPESSEKKPKAKRKYKKVNRAKMRVICDICGASICDKYNLKDHIELHFADPNAPRFYCDICINAQPFRPKERFSYTTRTRILAHMQRVHLRTIPVRKLSCNHCGKQFNHSTTLKFHINLHHVDPKDYEFECKICHKRFFRRRCYHDHQYVHTNEKNYSCDICGAKFSTARHRGQHVKNLHHPKLQTCRYCGKTFNTEKYLLQHLQSHEQNYSCPLCPGRSFSLTTTLRSHMVSTHPDFPLPPPGTKLKNFDWSTLMTN